LKSLKSWYKDK